MTFPMLLPPLEYHVHFIDTRIKMLIQDTKTKKHMSKFLFAHTECFEVYQMLKRIAIFMTILLISVQAASAAEIGVGVSPGTLSFELKPGTQGEQSLYVINTGTEAASYELHVDNSAYEGWFSVSPSSFSLQAGENKEVKVTLSVPSTAKADVDFKILVVPTSGTDVMAGVRVPVHIDVIISDSGSSYHSSGGSSGGGGGGGSPEPASNVEVKELAQQFVTNGNRIRFTFVQGVTSVGYVEFDAKKTAGKTTTIVEQLKGISVLTPSEPGGVVFQHINIWVGNGGFATQENIGNAVVGFRVSKAWLEENNIDASTITLQHFADDNWNSLPTTKVDEDDEYLHFEAETPGFSPFAITGQKIGYSETGVASAEGVGSGDTQDKASFESENEGDQEAESSPGFCSILAGAGLAISAVLVRRKTSR